MVGEEGTDGRQSHSEARRGRSYEQAQQQRCAKHPPAAMLDGQSHSAKVDAGRGGGRARRGSSWCGRGEWFLRHRSFAGASSSGQHSFRTLALRDEAPGP
jgi:hypothetical protein